MLINLSEVFTLEGKEKTWEVPFEAKAYKGSRVEYPVVSANPVKITVKNLGNRKLSLTGNTSVTLAIPCSRCLEPVNYTTDIEFDQEIDMNNLIYLVIIWMPICWFAMSYHCTCL